MSNLEQRLTRLGVKRPGCIAASFRDDVTPAAVQAAAADGLNAVELRIDLFEQVTAQAVVKAATAADALPIIATVRHAREGGAWQGSPEQRLALFEAAAPLVQALDVELSSEETAEALHVARDAGIASICSFHDFQVTPSAQRLGEIIDEAKRLGADIVKIATRVNEPAQLRRLTRLLLEHREQHIIMIGMGEHGLSSRVFFPLLGSLLTFAHVGASSAPGQLPLAETRRLLDQFSGSGAG